MGALHGSARSLALRCRQAIAGSAWAPVVGKGALVAVALFLLALVGSGRAARWLAPPSPVGIAVAQAATAPGPSEAAPAPRSTGPEVTAGDGDAGSPPESVDAGAPPTSGVAPDGKVILNLASEEDLRRLPGIGRGRAQAILALRGRLKKFTRVEDLLKVKGIGRRGLSRLRPLVRVD